MHPTTPEESMVVVEVPLPGAEVYVPDRPDAPIELRGEFDLFDLRSLGEALDGPAGAGRRVRVDLSGVTFLDVQCARELTDRASRGDRLTLSNPSREAERSLEACAEGPGGPGNENIESGGTRWT